MANLWHMLFGKKGRVKQAPTMTPQQQQLQQQNISGLQGGPSNIPGMEYLQQLLSNDPNAFRAYEAPMMRQFNEQIVPGIAERFAGMGMGAQGSSAFQNQIASAGARLSEALGAQRANLRGGAMNQIMGMYGQAMQPQFQNMYQSPSYGIIPQIMGGAGQGLGYGAGGAMGSGAYNYLMGGMNGMGGYGGYRGLNANYGQPSGSWDPSYNYGGMS